MSFSIQDLQLTEFLSPRLFLFGKDQNARGMEAVKFKGSGCGTGILDFYGV